MARGRSLTVGGGHGRKSRTASMLDRVDAMRDLVNYTTADERRVRATREVILGQADWIAEDVYQHLLSHPETAVHFTRPDGQIDQEQLDTRRHTLREWLVTAIEAPLDESSANYLASVGLAHTGRGSRAHGRVQGRYLLATMSYVQTALIDLFNSSIADRSELLSTIAAWGKLLTIHLDMFLAVYSSSEGTPKWY